MVARYLNCIRSLKISLILIASAIAVIIAAPTLSQAESLTQAHQKQIEIILNSARGPSAVTQALSRLGFQPGAEGVTGEPILGLKNWPDTRKLEAAFHMADAARAGSSESLLKDTMVIVARRNPAITAEEIFQTHILYDTAYVQTPGSFTSADAKRFTPRSYTFKAVNATTLAEPLPRDFRAVIDVISTHGSHHGKAVRFVHSCCRISPEEAYKKLRTSPDYSSLYEWALMKEAPPPTIETKVNRLVKAAVRQNAALAYEDALKSFAKAQHSSVNKNLALNPSSVDDFIHRNPAPARTAANLVTGAPDEMLTRVVAEVGGEGLPSAVEALSQALPSASGGGSSGQHTSSKVAARQFASFQSRAYQILPSQTSRATKAITPRKTLRFRTARVRARGFGGVFLGNKVTWDSDVPAPVWFEWHSINNEATTSDGEVPIGEWGYLFIVTANGDAVVTRPMRAHQVWAAVTTVYTGIEGVVAPLFVGDGTDGEGIGLAGFTGRHDYHVLNGNIVENGFMTAVTFVVHPSISGYPLGEDALLVDAYPFNFPDQLDEMVEAAVNRQKDKESIEKLKMFRAWLNDEDRLTYKFIDVPLRIERSVAGVIYTIRDDSEEIKNWPDRLRRQAFLTFQKFDKSGQPEEEENPPFYPIVPLLTQAWPSFSRLNDYAEILAIVRWLRVNEAVWQEGLEEPKRDATLTTLVIGDKVEPKLEPSLFEIKLDLAEQVLRQAENLVGQASPTYTSLNQQIHEARMRRLAAQEAIALYGLETIAPSDQTDELLEAREKLLLWQDIEDMPVDQFRLMITQQGMDVSELSDVTLQRYIREQIRTNRKVVTFLKDQIANTTEGKFIGRLEAHEKALADESPLAEGRTAVRLKLVGSIPESEQVFCRTILMERENLLKERGEVMTDIEQLRGAKVSPDENSESVLLKWLATEGERAKTQVLRTQTRNLTNEIDDPNTGFFRRLKAKRNRSKAIKNREKIISDLIMVRLNGKIGQLEKQADELNESAEEKTKDADKEMERLINIAPLPKFEEWWQLQISFQNQVFSN
jgi:hypothetical protein